jgi:hypothetical protein
MGSASCSPKVCQKRRHQSSPSRLRGRMRCRSPVEAWMVVIPMPISQSEHELPQLPSSAKYGPEVPDGDLPNGFSDTYRHGAQLAPADAVAPSHVPPAGRICTATPFAFVAALAVELAFVLCVLIRTRLSPADAVDTAASITAISAAGLYSRNAIVTIGRRLIGTAGHDKE